MPNKFSISLIISALALSGCSGEGTTPKQIPSQPPDPSRCHAYVDRAENKTPKTHQDRAALRFETICARSLTPYFIRSLQRALALRKIYRGPIHGIYDDRTLQAVQLYQSRLGIDSGQISLKAARELGLVPIRPHSGSIHTQP